MAEKVTPGRALSPEQYSGGFVDFFEEDAKTPLKKNILATNSNIHKELKGLINKKDIE